MSIGLKLIYNKFLKIYNLLAKFFYQYLVTITILFFCVMMFIAICKRSEAYYGVAAAFFGSIFVALKYKLDKSTYNKNIFEERYKLFITVDKVLWQWASNKIVTQEMIDKISSDFMRRSYFLFGKETYNFIVLLRELLIDIASANGQNPQLIQDNSHREDDNIS